MDRGDKVIVGVLHEKVHTVAVACGVFALDSTASTNRCSIEDPASVDGTLEGGKVSITATCMNLVRTGCD
jgi:glucose-6-phosphate dehydrogenase assembly protein OpcA